MKVKYTFKIWKYLGSAVLSAGLITMGMFGCGESDDPTPITNGIDKTVNQKVVGASAQDFLQSTNFNKLTVEIQYVEGFAPTQQALDNLMEFLEARLSKPNGITFKQTAIASPGLAPYSVDDIKSVEDQNRSDYNADETIAAYIFFADGGYSEDTDNSKVLGIAYRNTSMAIFESTVKDLSDGLLEPDRSLLESTILNHEVGHVLGLVGVGTPPQTDHQDFAHGHHCDVESCLMNWVVETGDVIENLANTEQVPQLDAQCIADLQANGGQ